MIMTDRGRLDLYSPKRQNQDSFLTNVKEIIKCLHDISAEIPENLATVSQGPNANVSVRTTASLQLMVYQVNHLQPQLTGLKLLLFQLTRAGHFTHNTPGHATRSASNTCRREIWLGATG